MTILLTLGFSRLRSFNVGHDKMDGDRQRLDPSQMKSEIGKAAAAQDEALRALKKLQRHRLRQVLHELYFYEDNARCELGEQAIAVALIGLARTTRREECEALFYSSVDILYCSTDDAEKTFTESEREQIYAAATVIHNKYVVEALNDGLREADRVLRNLDPNDPRHSAAAMLFSIQQIYLEHADLSDLCDYIGRCVLLCDELYLERWFSTDANVAQAIDALNGSACNLIRGVEKAIESGMLTQEQENGRIMKVAEDDDDEDVDDLDDAE